MYLKLESRIQIGKTFKEEIRGNCLALQVKTAISNFDIIAIVLQVIQKIR